MDLKYSDQIFRIKGVDKFLKEIKKALQKGERFILYGDADLDGSVSVIILEETLKFLGAREIRVYFPDRDREGYGLNEKALLYLSKYKPAVLVSLDCGITNFREILLAKRLGFKAWIIDHHEIIEKTPSADIIIAPKEKKNPIIFSNLSNAGLVFYLSQLLLQDFQKTKEEINTLFNEHLILVAMATIADMMPIKEINRDLIDRGLSLFPTIRRPGLRVFIDRKLIKEGNNREEIQKIISILNITKNKNHLTGAYRILRSNSFIKAEKIARELIKEQKERKVKIDHFIKDLQKEIREQKLLMTSPIIFVVKKEYPISFTGPIASKIFGLFKKPTFIIGLTDTFAKGAVRVPSHLDSIEALRVIKGFLENFGGHRLAAGFSVKKENVPKIKKILENYFSDLNKKQ